jgi:hypothetical protein
MSNNLTSVFFRTVSAFLLITVLSFHSFAQQESERGHDEFRINIELFNDVVKLTCLQGCVWNELAFTLHVDMDVDISHLGIGEGIDDYDDYGIADFRFNIKRNSAGLILESKNGTAWNNLSFSCRPNECGQTIDQYGSMPTKK